MVLLRALQSRGILKDETGKLAVGWLIVEDLVMVVVLVLIPPLAGLMGGVTVPVEGEAAAVASWGFGPLGATLLLTGVKVAGFIGLMLVVGARVIPMVLHYSMHTGQRELFRLAVLAIALGVAYGSAVFFGVSFALGAFFAGMVMASSTLSNQAMKDTLPLARCVCGAVFRLGRDAVQPVGDLDAALGADWHGGDRAGDQIHRGLWADALVWP